MMLAVASLSYTAAVAFTRDIRASRAIFFLISSGLYRLGARSCLPAYVSDPLLRLLAGWGGAQEHILHVVAGAGNFTGASVSVSCGNIVRDCH